MHVHIGTKKYVIIEESLCDGLWDWDISIERNSQWPVHSHGYAEKYNLQYRCELYSYNIIQYYNFLNLKVSEWAKK